jgi:hypothetical protein
MKRLLSIFLVLTLVIGCVLSLSSCSSESSKSSNNPKSEEKELEKNTPPEIPKGYTLYENRDISFAYPTGWLLQDGSFTIMTDPSGNGNNLNVVYETKNSTYDTITPESFTQLMNQSLNAMGMSISNVVINKKAKINNAEVIKISYKTSMQGSQMKQTALITHVGNLTYTITITEVVSDPTLVQNIYNSIYIKETN